MKCKISLLANQVSREGTMSGFYSMAKKTRLRFTVPNHDVGNNIRFKGRQEKPYLKFRKGLEGMKDFCCLLLVLTVLRQRDDVSKSSSTQLKSFNYKMTLKYSTTLSLKIELQRKAMSKHNFLMIFS